MTKSEKEKVTKVINQLMRELKRNTNLSRVKKTCDCSYCKSMKNGMQLIKELS